MQAGLQCLITSQGVPPLNRQLASLRRVHPSAMASCSRHATQGVPLQRAQPPPPSRAAALTLHGRCTSCACQAPLRCHSLAAAEQYWYRHALCCFGCCSSCSNRCCSRRLRPCSRPLNGGGHPGDVLAWYLLKPEDVPVSAVRRCGQRGPDCAGLGVHSPAQRPGSLEPLPSLLLCWLLVPLLQGRLGNGGLSRWAGAWRARRSNC
mmetsp:Transcript_23669/g.74414  ORF Transcript_23669/g.74414 Transcript_23669/m.74414 type:complete len:206 (+) Transcript_23669:171-788(+)